MPDPGTKLFHQTAPRARQIHPRAASAGTLPAALFAAAAVIVCLLYAGCTPRGGAAPPAKVVLITIDTTRADHLSAYGYDRETSPFLTALARLGVRFERAYVTMPTTDPSHASMLTGQHPRSHGIVRNADRRTDPSAPTIASWLMERGYLTAAITARLGLHPERRGLRGFVHADAPELPVTDRDAAEIIERVGRWIEALPPSTPRWFLWAHLWEPHKPYAPRQKELAELGIEAEALAGDRSELADPPRFLDAQRRLSDEAIAAATARYDAEILAADRAVASLLELARSAPPQGAEPLVMVVADHGESLAERQHSRSIAFGHGALLHDEVLRVPWIVAWPGRIAPRVISTPVSLVDLAPTLAGLVEPDASFAGEGRSLARAIADGEPLEPVALFAERRPFQTHPLERLAFSEAAIIEYPWKLIDNAGASTPELYRLDRDPGEHTDLAGPEAAHARRLRERLRAWQAERPGPQIAEPPMRRRRAEIEALRALGYID